MKAKDIQFTKAWHSPKSIRLSLFLCRDLPKRSAFWDAEISQ